MTKTKQSKEIKELTLVNFGGKAYWTDDKKIYRRKTTPPQSDWEKLRPEIVDGRLVFFDDSAKGDYPKIYFLKDILSQARAEGRKEGILVMEKPRLEAIERAKKEARAEVLKEVLEEIKRMNLWSKGTVEGTRQDIVLKLYTKLGTKL